MGASEAYNVWPHAACDSELTAETEDDLDAFRGLLWSIAISLVFVWLPIGFIIVKATRHAAGS